MCSHKMKTIVIIDVGAMCSNIHVFACLWDEMCSNLVVVLGLCMGTFDEVGMASFNLKLPPFDGLIGNGALTNGERAPNTFSVPQFYCDPLAMVRQFMALKSDVVSQCQPHEQTLIAGRN